MKGPKDIQNLGLRMQGGNKGNYCVGFGLDEYGA
jgi:hypothetical protein